MKRVFYKYHGTGNDFILIDHRDQTESIPEATIARLCDRHFGIGADGLMLLTSEPGVDFGMRYFNSDGNESTMCGNGGRCITAFSRQLGIIRDQALFLAIDGTHRADILGTDGPETYVSLHMADVSFKEQTRETSNPEQLVINTGSPHLILFVDDASLIDVNAEGRKHRYDPAFSPGGINVDFVQMKDNGTLFVRTYERGVEQETLSCGTGATAAVLALEIKHRMDQSDKPTRSDCMDEKRDQPVKPITEERRMRVETRGGELLVSFRLAGDRFTDIRLSGPATIVFRGEITL